MNYEKAIEDIKSNCWELCDYSMDKCEDDCEMKVAVEALESRIPKKPKITHHTYIVDGKEEKYELTHCQNCFHNFGYFYSLIDRGTKWCKRCGQAIDWNES